MSMLAFEIALHNALAGIPNQLDWDEDERAHAASFGLAGSVSAATVEPVSARTGMKYMHLHTNIVVRVRVVEASRVLLVNQDSGNREWVDLKSFRAAYRLKPGVA